jgi:hypothetical protein
MIRAVALEPNISLHFSAAVQDVDFNGNRLIMSASRVPLLDDSGTFLNAWDARLPVGKRPLDDAEQLELLPDDDSCGEVPELQGSDSALEDTAHGGLAGDGKGQDSRDSLGLAVPQLHRRNPGKSKQNSVVQSNLTRSGMSGTETAELEFSLLIAADGASSTVRACLRYERLANCGTSWAGKLLHPCQNALEMLDVLCILRRDF